MKEKAAQPTFDPGLQVIAFAIIGVALLVVPKLWPETEPFFVPKQLILGIGAMWAAFELSRTAKQRWQLSWFDLAVLGYFAVGTLSWAVARGPLGNAVGWLALEGCAALMLVFARSAADKPEAKRLIVTVVLASALAIAFLAVLEAWGVQLPWEGSRRPQSTLGNRNFVAAYLAIALPLAVHRALERGRFVQYAMIALLTLVVLLTRCRSAWLGLLFAAACATALWRVRRKRQLTGPLNRRRLLGCALSVAAAFLLAVLAPWPGLRWSEESPILSSFLRMAEYDQGSGKGRIDQHRVGLSIIAAHPLLGVGTRDWDDAAAEHANAVPGARVAGWSENPTPHSDLLRIATEMGLLAALAFLAGAILLARSGVARALSSRDSGITVALLAALAVASVNGLLDAPMYRPQLILLIAVLAGLLPAPEQRWELALPRAMSRGIPIAFGLALLTCAVVRAVPAFAILYGRSSIPSLQLAQKFFPRASVAQIITRRLAAQGRCAEALAEVDKALELSPHRWGVLQVGIICARKTGDTQAAERYANALRQRQPEQTSQKNPARRN
jgi:O-antigen ligase